MVVITESSTRLGIGYRVTAARQWFIEALDCQNSRRRGFTGKYVGDHQVGEKQI